MKAISLVLATSILTAICRAGLIPLEPLRTVVHPRYKPDVYAQFGNHDVECGHIATVKRGDERKCQERCHQYSSLLKEDCNAYTFRPGKDGGESTCMLKNYRCRPANWKRRHQSGLLGGCSYWCDKVPRGVDMSVCRNSDGSAWSCRDRDDDNDTQYQGGKRPEGPDHRGGPKDPHHPDGPKDQQHSGDSQDPHHRGGPKDSHHPDGHGPENSHHPGGPSNPHNPKNGPKDPHHPDGPEDPHHPHDPKDPHHPGSPEDPHHPGGPKDPHHPGGPTVPHLPDYPPNDPDHPHHPHHPHHPGPSQRAKPKPNPRFPFDLPVGGFWRRDMPADACPAPMTACPVVRSDGTLGEGLDCVETDQDLNQCGGCLGTGGVDCEKIAHAEVVGCASGRCKVFRCVEGFYARGDTCFRKLGQVVFERPNGY